MVPYIDIHTHQPLNRVDVIEIANIIPFHQPKPSARLYSAGVHPWYINPGDEHLYWEWLKRVSADQRCLMIGECGLDGVCKSDAELQHRIFRWQMEFASEMQKPMVIHCVKRHNEIQRLSKNREMHTPWILHDYHSSVEMTRQLLECNILFSFGAGLLYGNEKQKTLIGEIPSDRLFLETDDSGISIEKIYAAAGILLKIDVLDLRLTIFNNFNRVFNDTKLA